MSDGIGHCCAILLAVDAGECHLPKPPSLSLPPNLNRPTPRHPPREYPHALSLTLDLTPQTINFFEKYPNLQDLIIHDRHAYIYLTRDLVIQNSHFSAPITNNGLLITNSPTASSSSLPHHSTMSPSHPSNGAFSFSGSQDVRVEAGPPITHRPLGLLLALIVGRADRRKLVRGRQAKADEQMAAGKAAEASTKAATVSLSLPLPFQPPCALPSSFP